MLHILSFVGIIGFLTMSVPSICMAAVSENLLRNPFFAEGMDENGIPVGWYLYEGKGQNQRIKQLSGDTGDKVILLEDGDTSSEIGLMQDVPAKSGATYEARVEVKTMEGASSYGAYLQLRFLPSDKYVQTSIATSNTEEFQKISVKATAPPDTESARIYLYTHREPTPKLLVKSVNLVSGVEPSPPSPSELTPPVYAKLKDLNITTELVANGIPNITIITPASGIYDAQAKRIQQAIEELTKVIVPIETDESAAAAVPITGSLIALGNRSTSKTIGELYNRYYTLLDLRYPGTEGYIVRTLHNPFGNGKNVIFVGGSDPEGVNAAAHAFIERLKGAPGELAVGWIADIKMGKNIQIPEDIRKFETWEASAGYGSVGYFGWNSISKRMAMYYMTGDEFHAREFIRLAFPDKKAFEEISEIDGERIENKDEPLSGPYHYNAHLMILFWDLIEESPVFSDEERLRVTNAFSKQLNHRKNEGVYGRTNVPAAVGSRHGQWSAISLYCLGRYFQKDYPNPIWKHCVESAKLHFKPLHQHAWVSGENDNLFWYNTAIAPIFTYLLLTGDREPVKNGVLKKLLRAQEMLISGRQPDWALNSASIGYLHKAAYLMQDGRYLLYRQRTGVDMDIFRLGQPFWPEDHLTPDAPDDLVGKWSINYLPEPMWRARNSGLELGESFMFGSFRSTADASGDFILIDGFNGASRNPYHTFPILELRLNGYTLLKGYRNQLLTRADGLVEAHIAMNAALKHHDVLGGTAIATGEVPDAPYCKWRRTLIQRIGQYALVIDDLLPRTDTDNMEAQIKWEAEGRSKAFPDGHIEFTAPIEKPERRTAPGGQIWPSDLMRTTLSGRVANVEWTGQVREGEHKLFFSLVGMQPDVETASLGCFRVADNAAVLALPSPALVFAGEFRLMDADFKAECAVVSGDHIFARGLSTISFQSGEDSKTTLISAEAPVDVDWDLQTGMLHVNTTEDTRWLVASVPRLKHSGADASSSQYGTVSHLPEGRWIYEKAELKEVYQKQLRTYLDGLYTLGKENRSKEIAAAASKPKAEAPPLSTKTVSNVGGRVTDLITVGDHIYAAEGKRVHILSSDGKEIRTLEADGDIRMLRWWEEHKLLLVGCADEQVIAFDESGKRKWVFVSEMDPAVFRAAKTYWFKSAPGHEGIHGLYTGVFLDGKSQAFVGSACTLEILDENGELIRRMPQFWGKVSHFAIIDSPDGTLNLLASRKYNGNNTVAIINNKTLNPNPRGFHTVPPGSTYVPGWSSMNRNHLFYEDMDGDGIKEVISEINGTWNRVTIWQSDGKALYDASFGPGDRIPAMNMRDIDIADLDGDGRKEIVVATSSSLIVALDHQCRKIWATRLESPATVMNCVSPGAWIVAGCENGTVVVLNGSGEVIGMDRINGAPTCIDVYASAVLLATDTGEIKAFIAE